MKAMVTRCDQCEAEIPDGARSFTLGAYVAISNGRVRLAVGNFDHLCGEGCLTTALTSLVRKAESLPVEP